MLIFNLQDIYEITLVNEFNKNFISNLTKFSEIQKIIENYGEIYEDYYITCFIKFYYVGKYLVYLNCIYQDELIIFIIKNQKLCILN